MSNTKSCPVCDQPFKPADLCATDIELGICHAACLEGSPVVDLETGEELPDGKIDTFCYEAEARQGGAINRMLLGQMLQNAFFAGRGTSGIVSPEDMAAWQDYDYTKLEAYKRLRATLEAAALSTGAEPVRYQRKLDTGRWIEVEEEDIPHARSKGQEVRALYTAPPAPAVAVKDEESPMRFFSSNVDNWGALEWFNRMVDACEDHDRKRAQAFQCEDDDEKDILSLSADTSKMIMSSSAFQLVRQHKYEIRSAISAQVHDVAVPAGWNLVPVDGDATEEAAKLLCDWLGYAWDGVGEINLEGRFPDWHHGGVGGLRFQGGKPALRRIAAKMLTCAAPTPPADKAAIATEGSNNG